MRTPLHRGAPVSLLVLVGLTGLLAVSCSDSDSGGGEASPTTAGARVEIPDELDPACEILDDAHCLLPFPSDHFADPDEATATGLRVALPEAGMPANADGTPIDPTEWNRNDGFSPGAMLLASLPEVDLEASGAPLINDIARSLDDDSPIVVVDTGTGERHPVWAELDANAETDEGRLLIIRPAEALTEGHRYVVGLRDLQDADGEPLEVGAVFGALRDGAGTNSDAVEARRSEMEDVFADLEDAGIDRGDLQLAWGFTVASDESLAGRLLHLRDESFAELGDAAPTFTVDSVEGDPGGLRTVSGTIEVPRWLTGEGGPGSTLNNGDDPDGIPDQNGVQTVPFVCAVPPPVESGGAVEPAGVAVYGHGLLGSREETLSIGSLAGPVSNTIVCGTDWIGMSSGDVGNVLEVLGDLSRFPSIPDRLLQAHLDFLYLGRALVHPGGLGTDPAFQAPDGTPLTSDDLVYIGASQGGILGGATTAVAQDWERSLLAVGGMNYSTMLRRSIDFDEFSTVLEEQYPDEAERTISLALIQMLWDRGEAQGYAQHLTTDPYPDTPEHQVLLQEAFGDHQVPNIATETFARTFDAAVKAPVLEEGRATAVEPYWGLERVTPPDSGGSYLLVWDFGTPAPPTGNVPPREGEDPHGKISEVPAFLQAALAFLDTGELVAVCDGEPCRTVEE